MLSRRAKNIQPSPTLSLAAKAKELKAEGNDVISLTVGEPDWNTFPEVVDVAIESMKSGNTKYVPPVGIPALRKAIAEDYNTKFSTNYSDVNVSVSTGAKFILFAAFQAVIDQFVFCPMLSFALPRLDAFKRSFPLLRSFSFKTLELDR